MVDRRTHAHKEHEGGARPIEIFVIVPLCICIVIAAFMDWLT